MINIETERLIFKEYTIDDFDDLYEILSDKETMIHYPKPYDKDGTLRWINWNLDNYKKYGFGLWALILKENNKFIGDCGLTMQMIDGKELPEIGYHINKFYWRRGLGKEAAKAVKDYIFNNYDFDTLYSYMNSSNIASYSLASANGMKRIKEYVDKDGNSNYVYSITRQEWSKGLNK